MCSSRRRPRGVAGVYRPGEHTPRPRLVSAARGVLRRAALRLQARAQGQLFIDPVNPQSDLSGALHEFVEDMLAADQAYRERLIGHYGMWKAVVDDAGHPDHAKIRNDLHDNPAFRPAFPKRETARREGPNVGANDPCPCGSGKKHKKRCRP